MAAKKIPHFMKTIMNTNARDKRLRVPKTFMDKHGEHLSDQIHLKLPGGSESEIKLRRCAGEFWFEKGWPEFSKFCSLDFGSCLVFQYEGKSKFHVLIFDESGTEIEYPIMPQIEGTDEEEDDDMSIEEILEIEDDEEDNDKSVESLEIETDESSEILLIDEDDDDDVKSVESSEFFPLSQEKNRRKPRSSSKPSSSSSSSSSLRATVKAANKFVPSHPFFKITLGPSRKAHVPGSFRKHFTPVKNQTARLLVGDRLWPVTLIFHPQNYRFSAGWGAFEKANWLKEGDICIFELMDKKNLALEVNIFRC
ncbi:PREDICTED: B3 domain-containing transcription factor VRN1-like [Prunus mume]|uniref:B3 domain-containing transcription factor VRN1-like n=1 Tax=Prunus mume TaxID=102107 RepID=A0ABM0N2X1_PRUMU|nr:PREDICTED: B3 domain-containing transcription factor VRN1-like [Prunus mume]